MTVRNGSGGVITTYRKPSTANVFGCDGDLPAPNDDRGAISRTICTGLNRGTLHKFSNQPPQRQRGLLHARRDEPLLA